MENIGGPMINNLQRTCAINLNKHRNKFKIATVANAKKGSISQLTFFKLSICPFVYHFLLLPTPTIQEEIQSILFTARYIPTYSRLSIIFVQLINDIELRWI